MNEIARKSVCNPGSKLKKIETMKTYLADIIPKIKRYSEKLDNLTLLTNQHWVVIDELNNSKFVYIFRSNFELLISQNGKVEKGKWEYLGNNSLLIERKDDSYLFRHGFFDANILALKVDGREEYAFLVNENKYGGDLNSIEKVLYFLESTYLKMMPHIQLQPQASITNKPDNSHNLELDKVLKPIENINWKYGYVDSAENLIINHMYDRAYDFSEELALVYNTINEIDYYGFINEKGDEVISLEFEFAESFSEGFALVRLNRKFGFIDNLGIVMIPIEFDNAQSFENGKAEVKVGDHSFYIGKDGYKK
jgi:hypothetical protein